MDTDTEPNSNTDTGACGDTDTCDELACGSWTDGCGREIVCGDCDSGHHCTENQCIDDFSNGEVCTKMMECESDHCNNSLCCDKGICCTSDLIEQCNGFVCDIDTFECVTSCGTGPLQDDGVCADGFHCEDDLCVADKADGTVCEENSDCISGHCDNAVCCKAGETCCSDSIDCLDETAPFCTPETFTCNGCDIIDNCAVEFPDTPVCDEITGGCVACVTDEDCIGSDAAPFDSQFGICTPDNICTCYLAPGLDPQLPESACTADGDCPDGYVCALDLDNPGVINDHFACLKPCTEASGPENGITCEMRAGISQDLLVWVPMTTCYAFSRFGIDCATEDGSHPDQNKCRISFDLDDGTCSELPGRKLYRCSYSCEDEDNNSYDEWCPALSTGCDDSCGVPL